MNVDNVVEVCNFDQYIEAIPSISFSESSYKTFEETVHCYNKKICFMLDKHKASKELEKISNSNIVTPMCHEHGHECYSVSNRIFKFETSELYIGDKDKKVIEIFIEIRNTKCVFESEASYPETFINIKEEEAKNIYTRLSTHAL